ncbi:MAG: M23 family metallopeptidase [Vicinamibacterales bacterium]
MKEFEVLLTQVAWGVIAVLVVLVAGAGIALGRTWSQRGPLGRATRGQRVLSVAALLSRVALVAGLLGYLFVLQRGSSFMPPALKLAIAGLLMSWLLLQAAAWLRPRRRRGLWADVWAGLGALVPAVVGGGLLWLYAASTQSPALESSVMLDLPFDGEWVATGAGASARTNHHHRIASQRHAVDVAKACPDGRLFRGDGRTHAESCTFGALVLSPAAGVVVHVVDGLADGDSRRELPGNHVIIRVTADRFVALAHLQQGSVAVAEGDTVVVGQPIGRAGNSGNSDFPHLHVHVQDGPVYDLRGSRSIPFRFRQAEVKRFLWWRLTDDVALLANDRIRPLAR